jgi:type I restriction enzyme, S subunit
MAVSEGYVQTQLGPLPSDWKVVHVRDLGVVVRGASPRPAGDPRYFDGSFLPWLTVAALTTIPDSQLVVSSTPGGLTEEGAKFSRTLPSGTLIIANSGATLGVAKVLGITCCANDGVAAIVNQSQGDKRFVCHYINTQTRRLREVVATGNGQPNLNTGLIGDISLPFPPVAEQQAISEALSDVDALLTKLDQLIAKRRDLKQAAMRQLLTGRTRLVGFSGPWAEMPLAKIGAFLKGRGVSRDQASTGSIACIRYGEIYTAHHDIVRSFTSWISREVAASAIQLKAGDILFAGSGETKEEIGKCVAFVEDCEAYAGGDIVILRPRGMDSRFLGYALNTPDVNRQKANFGQGDAVVHISAAALGAVTVRLPPVEEQAAVADVLTTMDAELTAVEARRDKTRQLKRGMMQVLLTGRIRLV